MHLSYPALNSLLWIKDDEREERRKRIRCWEWSAVLFVSLSVCVANGFRCIGELGKTLWNFNGAGCFSLSEPCISLFCLLMHGFFVMKVSHFTSSGLYSGGIICHFQTIALYILHTRNGTLCKDWSRFIWHWKKNSSFNLNKFIQREPNPSSKKINK